METLDIVYNFTGNIKIHQILNKSLIKPNISKAIRQKYLQHFLNQYFIVMMDFGINHNFKLRFSLLLYREPVENFTFWMRSFIDCQNLAYKKNKMFVRLNEEQLWNVWNNLHLRVLCMSKRQSFLSWRNLIKIFSL